MYSLPTLCVNVFWCPGVHVASSNKTGNILVAHVHYPVNKEKFWDEKCFGSGDVAHIAECLSSTQSPPSPSSAWNLLQHSMRNFWIRMLWKYSAFSLASDRLGGWQQSVQAMSGVMESILRQVSTGGDSHTSPFNSSRLSVMDACLAFASLIFFSRSAGSGVGLRNWNSLLLWRYVGLGCKFRE